MVLSSLKLREFSLKSLKPGAGVGSVHGIHIGAWNIGLNHVSIVRTHMFGSQVMGLITSTVGTHKESIVVVPYMLSTFTARSLWLHQSLINSLTITIAV